jgi:thiol-disulfide isomerase/thioredoxin
MTDIYYSDKRIGEVNVIEGKRTIIVDGKDGFIGKRKNNTQLIPDFTYEYGDSIFYWYFDAFDSTYLFESELKQDYSRGYGLNSYWIKLSLNRLIDSSANSLFEPTPIDTIIRGKSCWELRVVNELTPIGYLNWSVFVSKLDTIPLGTYQQIISPYGDTTITFSFMDSIYKSISIQEQFKRQFLLEIESLKMNRKKRKYNNFVFNPNSEADFIEEVNSFSILKLDSVNLNFKKGKYFVDFWFVGCFPCAQSMPYLDILKEQYSKKSIEFIKLNPVDFKFPEKVIRYSKLHLIEIDNYIIHQIYCQDFGIKTYPTFLFIEDGVIIKKFEGFDETVYEELKKYLEIWTADSR